MTGRARSAALMLVVLAVAVGGCSSGGTPAAPQPSGPSTSPAASPSTSTPVPTGPAGSTSRRASAQAAPAAHPSYAFPVRGCHVTYARSHHDYPATDIFAARGCAFVAPTSGVVTEVSTRDHWSAATNRGRDRGGLSVALVGSDGVRYYGSHLEAVATGIRPGTKVSAGQRLGRVGNTGDAAGIASHLHFGISWPTRPGVWWVRRGEVYPWPYLDAWRRGHDRSPAAAVARTRRAAGTEVPRCVADC